MIFKLRYGLFLEYQDLDDALTQKEVAEYFGVTQSYISRLERKILLKIRKELKK